MTIANLKKSLLMICIFFFACCRMAFAEEFIAYSHLSSDGFWQIWTLAPDGTNKKQITLSSQDKREPAISNDGRQIAFRNNNGELFMMNTSDQKEIKILPNFKNINNPFFSNSKDEILFVRFDPRVPDVSTIWKSDLAGKNAQILVQARRRQYHPTLSLQGDVIAFVKADTQRHHHVWEMNADGSNLIQLTEGNYFDVFPAFSPDGQLIAFSSNRENDNYEIFAVNVKTKTLTKLTKNPALDSRPYFSPDGKKIVFVSNRSGQQELWLMNADGTNSVQLTQGQPGEESINPAWVKISAKE